MPSTATIVAVCGLPGSGKSYFASRLAAKINAVYISSDETRKEMFATRTYSDREKIAVYREMVDRALRAGGGTENVVLDATFYKEEVRALVAQAFGPSLRWIEVTADDAVIRDRLARPRTHSDADFGVYKRIKAGWEPLTVAHLLLQSRQDNIDDMVRQAIEYLRDDQRNN